MNEKLICCQVCQVYFVSASAYFQPNPSVWANTAQPATKPASEIPLCRLCEMFPVLLSLYCEDFIKVEKLKAKTQSTDHITKVWCSASLNGYKAARWGGRETIVAGAREETTLQPELSGCFCSPGRQKVRNLVTLCKCVTASSPTWMQTSSAFCFNVCHICPCHAMPCICAAVTRLISLLLAEWIKKPHIHCFALPLSCSNLRKRQN